MAESEPRSSDVMGRPLGRAFPHGKGQLRAVERLGPGHLVNTEYDRTLGRVEVEARHAAELLLEALVPTGLEGLHPVRRDASCLPDLMDGVGADPLLLGHGRVDRGVAFEGRVRNVSWTMARRVTFGRRKGPPGRGARCSMPVQRSRWNRFLQSVDVVRWVPSSSAIRSS